MIAMLWAVGLLAGASMAAEQAQRQTVPEPAAEKDVIYRSKAEGLKATEPAPKPVPALTQRQLGDIMMARKRYREAIDIYTGETGRLPLVLTKLGIAYHQSGQRDQAKESYQNALEWDGRYAAAINNLGVLELDNRNSRSAEKRFQTALSLAAKSPAVQWNLAAALFARERYQDAIAAFTTAVQLEPGIEKRAGYDMEEPMLIASIERTPEFDFCLYSAYERAGMKEVAAEHLEKARSSGFEKETLKNRNGFIEWFLGLFH